MIYIRVDKILVLLIVSSLKIAKSIAMTRNMSDAPEWCGLMYKCHGCLAIP